MTPWRCVFTALCAALVLLSKVSAQRNIPINGTDMQNVWLQQLNQRRMQSNGANMECVKTWNQTLANIAYQQGRQCNAMPPPGMLPATVGVAFAFSFAPQQPRIADFIRNMQQEGIRFYDPTARGGQGACQPRQNCANYLQAFYHKGDSVGCALFRCPRIQNTGFPPQQGFFVACAFTFRNPNRGPPFASGTLCAFCGTTPCTRGLCCPFDYTRHDGSIPLGLTTTSTTTGTGPTTTTTAPPRPIDCGRRPTSLVPLTRMYNRKTTTNVFVTSDAQIAHLLSQGFQNMGVVGQINSQAADPNCRFLRPIYHIYSSLRTTDYYLINDVLYNVRLTQGWRNDGIIGYAVPATILCSATTNIYEFFDNRDGYLQYSDAGQTVDGLLRGKPKWTKAGGISFAIW